MIKEILKWFQTAKPNPTEKDKATQIGAHFEEVGEMMLALDINAALVSHISKDFYEAPAIDLDENGYVLTMPHNWELDLLDSLCDQIVTAVGVAHMMGYDIAGALEEVNASNFSKFEDGKPLLNENGKIIKGKNYFKPQLEQFLCHGKNNSH